MRKLPRHLTVRVEREVAETFHARMARENRTASDFLRDAIRAALTEGPANDAPGASTLPRAA